MELVRSSLIIVHHFSGAEIVDEDVIRIQRSSKDQTFHLVTNSGKEYSSQSLILSTGAQALWLNAKNEETFKGQDD
jgi:thioredoxin reductase (NADPH)